MTLFLELAETERSRAVKAWLEYHQLSPTQIGALLGVNPSSVSRFLHGERRSKRLRNALFEMGMPFAIMPPLPRSHATSSLASAPYPPVSESESGQPEAGENMRLDLREIKKNAALRSWLAYHGYTPAGLAKELGVDPSFISRYLRGARRSKLFRAKLVNWGVPEELLP